MMTRTPSILFWFGLIIIASVALYRTSDRVQELNHQLHELNASIDNEQQSIHVLKAEWAYLSSPARIENSAKKYLALRPTAPKQIASLENLPEILPVRGKTVASAGSAASPIATIKTANSPRRPCLQPVAATTNIKRRAGCCRRGAALPQRPYGHRTHGQRAAHAGFHRHDDQPSSSSVITTRFADERQ